MAEERVKRKLAAIVSADVVGWSRLMGEDEAGTLAALKRHREELIDPKIAEYGGRIVSTAGDSVLVEYPSAVDAVKCSVEIQEAVARRNADLPEDKKMLFRVGVNLGEVIVEGHDVFGEGVNVAARLQTLAEPGGTCLSGEVHQQVAGKLDVAFDDLGEKTVKNIAKPVQVYAVSAGSAEKDTKDVGEDALKLPAKPSIAVLPFDNMSGDPEQDYFADGIVEDITTELSRSRRLFVIARNSSFAFKGQKVSVKDVGRELGVRYVLEGSVRRLGQRVRITGQLIEAETGNHIWAERFDGGIEDLFDLQDEVTTGVVGAIYPEIEAAEIDRARSKRPDDHNAYDLVLRGWSECHRLDRESLRRAQGFARRAVELEPSFAGAYTLIGWSKVLESMQSQGDEAEQALRDGLLASKRAIDSDPSDAHAHVSLSLCLLWAKQHDVALMDAERAISLNPNLANAHFVRGAVRVYMDYPGHAEEALSDAQTALRLSPRDPLRFAPLNVMVLCHLSLSDYEAAARTASELIATKPDYVFGHANKAVALGLSGRIDEARKALQSVVSIQPKFDRTFVEAGWPWQRREDLERIIDGLRKAGWEG